MFEAAAFGGRDPLDEAGGGEHALAQQRAGDDVELVTVEVPSAWKKAAALESWPTESAATASAWCAARVASSFWIRWKSALSWEWTISAATTEPAAISRTATSPSQKRNASCLIVGAGV